MSRKLRTASAVLVIFALLCSCSCGAALSVRVPDGDAYTPKNTGTAYHSAASDSLTLYSESERVSLYCSDITGAPVIIDRTSSQSLSPLGEKAASLGAAYVLGVVMRDESGNRYVLNTGDNSACFGAFKVVSEKNGYSVLYSLSTEKKNALCELSELPKAALRLDVKLTFTLTGDVFRVGTKLSEAFVSDGYFIENITLVPGMSVSGGDAGDFFVLPDGSGAMVDLSYVPENDLSSDILVYGSDASVGEVSSFVKAYAPVFGARLGSMLYCAAAEEGDALLNLRFERKADTAGGAVFPIFTVTPSQASGKRVYFGTSYTGEIKLAYSFADAEGGTYSTVAVAARELLERNGVLGVNTEEADGDIPFFLTVAGSTSDKKKNIYTKYGEAREILEILKAKGVNRVLLRYSGALTGGLSGCDARDMSLNSSLEGKNAFKSLCDYAAAQGVRVYTDVNLLLRDGGGKLKTLNGKSAEGVPLSAVPKAFGVSGSGLGLTRISGVSDGADTALSLISDTGCSGASLNDVTSYLYSDASGGFTRQDAVSVLNEKLRAFCVVGDVVLDEPVMYLMRYASYADALPLTASLGMEPGITSVPLLQMILHGYVLYTCGSLNSYGSFDTAALKCAEYGSLPSAMLTYSSSKLDYETCYTVLANDIAGFYTKLSRAVGDLGAEKITSHRLVREGVYCTEYSNSAKVYVNYTHEDVIINGITLSARDFIRVD